MSIDRPRIEMSDMLASIREAIEKETAGLRQAATEAPETAHGARQMEAAGTMLAEEDDLQFVDQPEEPAFLRRLPERETAAPAAGAVSPQRTAAHRPRLHAVTGGASAAALAIDEEPDAAHAPSPHATPEIGPALEHLVREMLKPMLREWLDDYLPGLVEEMVREEIVRILQKGLSGGAGGA